VPPLHWWRTVFFLIPAISVYTLVLGTLSLASALVDPTGRFAHGCARVWAWLILATTGVDAEVRGLDRLPRGQGHLIASNHQSIYDIPILFWHLPLQLRILAKVSLGRFPFLGWHLARTGHVLVDRRKPGSELFRRVRELMRTGISVLVFPEGTRSVDGSLARFKGGIFLMAIEAGLPIVPVAVNGSRFVMRKGRLMTCPGHVTVQILDPIPTAGLEPSDARGLANRVRAAIAQAGLPLREAAPVSSSPSPLAENAPGL
jgi:1-acyl-sn-glycerol-3-phosphate acyltransferase